MHLRPELLEPSDFTGSFIYIYIYLSFSPPWHHPLWCGENLGKFVHLHAQKSRNSSRSRACDLFFKNGTLMRAVTRGWGPRSGLPGDVCAFQLRWKTRVESSFKADPGSLWLGSTQATGRAGGSGSFHPNPQLLFPFPTIICFSKRAGPFPGAGAPRCPACCRTNSKAASKSVTR